MARLIVVAAASIGLILLVAFITSRLLRSRRRGMSIRLQLFIALGAIVGAFAFGLGVMVIDRIEARAHRFATDAANDKAVVIAKLVGAEMEQYGLGLMELARRLPDRASPHELEGVELYGPHEDLLFRSSRGFPSEAARRVTVEAAIFVHGEVRGRVRVTKTTIVMETLLKDFAPTVLVISLVLGAAAAIAAVWIGATIAGPLEALSEFSDRVASGESQAAPPPSPHGREVTRLSRSIDSMRRQLEGRPFVEAFAADLSHELKNPVAAIRASAEVLDEGALDEPLEARRFVARIRESVARIERLLSDLLNLARIEAHGVEDFAPVDLGAIARAACEHEPQRERVELTSEPDALVRGEAIWLSRALTNLLDNALLHSNGGLVRVEVTRRDGKVHARIHNQGAIAKHARERVFRRFFTTREDKGGSGLGLAIVLAVAEAHGGEVKLEQPGPPEVTFRLTLPAA